MKPRGLLRIGLTLVVAGFVVWVALLPGRSPGAGDGRAMTGVLPMVGQTRALTRGEPCFRSVEAMERGAEEANAHDVIGWDKMMADGDLFLLGRGTQVLGLEEGWLKERVRVLGGRHVGVGCWIAE